MAETVNGPIERVTFHNPENGFCVLRIKLPGRPEPATVVGHLSQPSVGEFVEAVGDWVLDKQHGRQFRAAALRTAQPSSVDGIQRYLGSGAIRSIGPQLAEKIVGIYKERTLEVLDKSPDMLLHIRGIGPKRYERIKASWDEQREVRRIMLFLQECGLGGGGRAIRIYRHYGQAAIEIIKSNPYKLADDIRGIGFKTADALARKLGMAMNAPARVRAGIRFVLAELTGEGHVACPETLLVEQASQLLEVDEALVSEAIEFERNENRIVREPIDGDPWIYLTALHRAEVGIAQSVQRLVAASSHPLPSIDIEKAIEWVERKLNLPLAPRQRDAVREACRAKFLVITGGPGVGKTTIVRSILEIFLAKRKQCLLAAPTGRAAKRLAESTGQSAKTIHRLLEFDPSSGDFLRGPNRPLEADLVIIDEASMIDIVLGHQLLRAIPDSAAVLLVGDVDQLPSVGPGTVLADLIASQTVPVARLTEIFRQARESRIITAAHAIHSGEEPETAPPGDKTSDFYLIEAETPDAIRDMVVRMVAERIPARFGVDPKRDVQVLAPMHRGELGTQSLNEALQNVLNPKGDTPEVERFGTVFRLGDRVIQTENSYKREVFNGDLGVVQAINRVEQQLTVAFEGREVEYDFGDLDELQLAYALSIHKSQGSEYPCVVIPLHTQHFVMLQRNLIYTAVTRGRRLVVLVGPRKALAMAVRRQDQQLRYTALKQRLISR
ncbi:MAG: ATP-dependent RecD-like helicase [Planctomycetota bacterium]|jgi:exodeoxyribonuclease V alpha subunit